MGKNVFVGVDGCKAGWFAVFLEQENKTDSKWEASVFPEFSCLIDFLENNFREAEPLVLVDIPIGLKDGG